MDSFQHTIGRHALQHAAQFFRLIVAAIFSFSSGCFATTAPPTPAQRSRFPAPVAMESPADVPTKRPTSSALPNILPQFVDVATTLGIDFSFFNDEVPGRFFLPEVMGGGIAWIDFDRDGWLDLFHANGCELQPPTEEARSQIGRNSHRVGCRLHRNVGAVRFDDVTDASQLDITLYGQGCAVGDFDGDGFDDLFVAGFGTDCLLHNCGDGTFRDVTQTAAVSDPDWSSSSLWLDIDGDGNLDLYVVNYMDVTFQNHQVCDYAGRPGYCGPGSYGAVADRAYINHGDGTFIESAAALGLIGDDGKGLAVAAVDFDDDGVPEIYVANDMTANFLFSRRSGATEAPLYHEVARPSGAAVSGAGMNEASMGIAIADFDSDGRPDIYLTHYYRMKNTLYRNLGGLLFDDDSYRSRTAITSLESLGFGTAAVDYDRDGDPDLFISNGHVLGPQQQPHRMPPQLLRNDRGVFTDVSRDVGPYFTSEWIGRSVAAADFDNDGDLDFAVSHLGTPAVLLDNQTDCGSRPFLALELMSRNGLTPIGGRVRLRTRSRTMVQRQQTAAIAAGGSYLASPDRRVLFGWPEDETFESIEIRWPSGRIDEFNQLTLNRYWYIREGQSPLEQAVTLPSKHAFEPGS